MNSFTYLKKHLAHIFIATIFSIVLAGIASLIAILIGPSMKLLLSPDLNKEFLLSNLLGKNISDIIYYFSGMSSISSKYLLKFLPICLISLSALKAFLSISQWFIWERITEICAKGMRMDIFKKYLQLDPNKRKAQYKDASEETLSSSISTDIKITREYMVQFYGGLPREILQVLFLTITLIFLSADLFLIFFIAVVPAVFFAHRFGIKLKSRVSSALRDFSQLTEWFQQRLLGIETIKHYKTEQIEINKMSDLNDNLFYRFYKVIRINVRTSPILEFITILAIVLVLIFALNQINVGKSTGAIQLSFFSTLVMLSQSASRLSKYFNVNRQGSAALNRLQNMFEFLSKNQKPGLLINIKPDNKYSVVFKDVFLLYKGNKDYALKGINHIFKDSKIYCIYGPSGAGKTSLFNIMLGIVPITKGDFFITSPLNANPNKIIGYMPQKVELIPGCSVAENIAYPDLEFDETRIIESIKKVKLESVILSSPQGIHSIIDDSTQYSGGEQQRIQLARLWYHKYPINLIDEGTSALDPETEHFIYDLLKDLVQKFNLTVIIISHRQSGMSFADETIFLEKGIKKEGQT